MTKTRLSTFVRYNRQRLGMTQAEFARKSGVGLRFIRELEQGKEALRLDKVNQVLLMFGHIAAPAPTKELDPYDILLNYMQKDVRISLANMKVISGRLKTPILKNGEITAWRFEAGPYTNERQKDSSGTETIIHHSDIRGIKLGFI